MRKKLVAGNWKMHGSIEQNKNLLDKVVAGTVEMNKASCAVCVPYPYLNQVHSLLKDTHVPWGAQNLSQYDKGAYTGEVSANMLKDFSCHYVIVGHSERRTLFGEDNHIVSLKFRAALDASLVPILCVGETLDQREDNLTEELIGEQLDTVIDVAGVDVFANSVVAYEPIWAIGTGKTATPQQAQDVHVFIRNKISSHNAKIAAELQILYGGSVKANNAAELFSMSDIDGGLIGGASLVAEEFISICLAANN